MRISDWSSDVCSSDLKGTTPAELERTINSNVRALPGSFETSDDVLGGIRSIVKFGRADDYYEKLPATYEAMTAAEIDAAARKALSVDDRSEEHTSELQSLMRISYAVFCLKKKKTKN